MVNCCEAGATTVAWGSAGRLACCEAETERGITSGGRWQPRVAGGGNSFSGLRSRQSGIRYGLSGSGTGAGLNLHLVLNT